MIWPNTCLSWKITKIRTTRFGLGNSTRKGFCFYSISDSRRFAIGRVTFSLSNVCAISIRRIIRACVTVHNKDINEKASSLLQRGIVSPLRERGGLRRGGGGRQSQTVLSGNSTGILPVLGGNRTGSFASWTKILTFHVIVLSAFALKATFSNGKHF